MYIKIMCHQSLTLCTVNVTEAATEGVLLKKGVLKICKFIKKETLAQVFSWKFYEIFKTTFFTEHFRTTALDFLMMNKNNLIFLAEKLYVATLHETTDRISLLEKF